MRALVCEYILDADKGEWAMRTVVTRMPAADLAEELAAMRRWLDKNAIEPLKFTCKRYEDVVAVCAEFNKEAQAEAFRSRFDDQKRRRPHDELLLSDYRWALNFHTDGQQGPERWRRPVGGG
jgi:aminoglycoside phosphotransferase